MASTITGHPSSGPSPFTIDNLTPNSATLQEPTNNSSAVQHENPSNVDKSSDTAALQQWFASRLRSQLRNSSRNLSQGEYETVRKFLGDDFNQTLNRYVELVEQTPSEEDDQVADRLQNTTAQHREYVSTVEEYRDTRDAYLTAKQRGNETRARRLARELERLSTQINRSETSLIQSYEAIGNATDSNFTVVKQSISNVEQNVSTIQTSVRRSEFTRTTIIIEEQTTNISFRNPLVVTGRLNSVNGTALGNRTIAVQLGPQTVLTNTTANGSFTVTARPARAPRGRQTVSVHYLPENVSVFLGTSTAITVNASAVTPSVTLTQFPNEGEFNETISIAGQVAVANVSEGPEEVPVRITLGSTILGTAYTNATGSFVLNASIPASMPAGTQKLRVTIALTNRSLTTANTTDLMTIHETPTQLSVKTVQQSSDHIRLSGKLTTETGIAIANQTVSLQLAGQTVTTVTTNQSGAYSIILNTTNITPSSAGPTANVTMVFAGSGNLNQAIATTDVKVGGATKPWSSLPVSPLVLGTGVLGMGVVGALALRRRNGGMRPSATPNTSTENEDTTSNETAATEPTVTEGQPLLEQATSYFEDGNHDDAVRLAYQAVRQQAAAQLNTLENSTAQTHWEFYRAWRAGDDHTTISASELESLTESFEQAQFTSRPPSSEQAMTAVKTATAFVSETAPEK